MIAYIRGTLAQRLADRVVIDCGGLGYEVFAPAFLLRSLQSHALEAPIELHVYYHVTERSLRPTLFGFGNRFEKSFFEKFISVEGIGPQRAARSLIYSVSTIARAIEAEDTALLRQLPGVGDRTAKQIVATLRGKVTEEALLRDEAFAGPVTEPVAALSDGELRDDAIEILIGLGHRRTEAQSMVSDAIKRRPEVTTIEELIQEVYAATRA